MRDIVERPAAVSEAQKAQKGWHWLVELLVFVAVFVIAQFGQMLVLIPGELVMLFTNEEYTSAAAAGDMDKITEVSSQIAASDGYMILMLVSCIMMTVVVCLFCKIFQKRGIRSVGFRREHAVREYLVGAAGGFLFFSAAVLIAVLTGSLKLQGISSTLRAGILVLYLLGYFIQGMAEEVLCRGYLMVSIARRYTMTAAILANSLFFAALHLFNSGISPLAIINLTLFGIFASLYFVRRGNIWGVAAFHFVWNFVQGNFYGIRVSGIDTTASVLETVSVEGKSLWNGGAFGMEGGIAATIVLAAGILILYRMKNVDAPQQWKDTKAEA